MLDEREYFERMIIMRVYLYIIFILSHLTHVNEGDKIINDNATIREIFHSHQFDIRF